MKKLSIILALILVTMVSCTKSKEVHPEIGDGNDEFVTVGMKDVHVEYTRTDHAELSRVVFHYCPADANGNAQQFEVAEMTKKETFFELTLTDLFSDTLYWYYYELFPNNGDAFNTVQKTFHTQFFEQPGPPIPMDGLVAYYPFNGNSIDETGNGHNGTIIGDVTLCEDRKGNDNSAYRFSGEPFNYISVEDTVDLHLSTFTLNAWVYTDADDYGYNAHLICKGRDVVEGSYSLKPQAVRAMNYYYGDNEAGVEEIPEVRVWHMITGTVQGDQAKFYIDGVLMDEQTLTYPFEYYNEEPLTLGMHYYTEVPDFWTYPLLGVLDDVRIYNRVLTIEEIQLLYSE